MAKGKRSARPRAERAPESPVRAGGTRLNIPNSGLEVWLYDDDNRGAIREENAATAGFGGMPGNVDALTRRGLIVGYSLMQDDPLDVAVHAGDPFTESELSVARWLEPQTAFLRLPSGKLCIESNDASRIGPEEPTEKGGVIDVPPGDYRLTLYRIDDEALDRERRTWAGPQEIILLTAGGRRSDAAGDLLPFEPRRDLTWVGKYKIDGRRAEGLAWFADYWDTFVLNLDREGASALSLAPGSYFQTHVPPLGITLVSVFADSWEDAKSLPMPSGIELDEYGYASFVNMSDWNGAQALFCRRDTSKSKVEVEHHNVWIPAVVEILDAKPETRTPVGERFAATDLRKKNYFDPGFLSLVLSDLLPEVADRDELGLADALDLLDRKLGRMGLKPQGDLSWEDREGPRSAEAGCRLYTGLPDSFAALYLKEGIFVWVLLTELGDGAWIVTGLADDLERRIKRKGDDGLFVANPRVQLLIIDEPLAKIAKAHSGALKKSKSRPAPAPADLQQAVSALERFLAAAFD
jgi:hypothetical protein